MDGLKQAQRRWLALGERWALPAVLLLAFALRLYRLGDKNIWWDEGLAIWAVRKGLLGATLWTAQDVHPPLYFWSLWAWVHLVGESEFAARFLSAMWGVLTVAIVYPLGTRLGGRRVGLLAALLTAVARFHIWWSQEMRMYVLAALAATVTLYVAIRWLDEERKRSRPIWAAVYALAAAACLYSIYLAGLAPLVANCYALPALARIPAVRRRGAVRRWLAAQVGALALLVPWLLLALPRMHTWSVSEPFSFRLFLDLYATLLTLGVSTDVERYLPWLVPFALILLGGLAASLWPRQRPEPDGGRALWLFVPALLLLPLAVYILTRPHSLFYTPRVEARYLLLFAPAFYAFLAWAMVHLGRRIPLLGLAALGIALGTMVAFLPGYYAPRYLRDEMQTMTRLLGAYARPGDVVLLISGDRYQLFGYYYERDIPPERRIPVVLLPQGEDFSADNVAQQLSQAIEGRKRFWVAAVEAGIQDPNGLSLPWLDQHFRRAFTYNVGYNALILYGDEGAPLLVEGTGLKPQRQLRAQRGSLELLGYDLPGREYRAGDTVDLGIYAATQAPGQAVVEWQRDDGEVLQTVTQTWPATGPSTLRAATRFNVWPWLQSGGTHFVLRWQPAAGGEPQTVRLAGPRLQAAPDRPRVEQIAQPLDITFAKGIRLRGYDLRRPVRQGYVEARPGETLTLDLFWEADQPVAEDYTVFTHLVGSAYNPATGGPLWAQHDGPPVGGTYVTTAWMPNQLVADRHVLRIDPAAPPGDYVLEAGLYLPATQARLRQVAADGSSGDDRVVLVHVRVE